MRLVAMIRSQDLIQPLVVRHFAGKPKYFEVFAGKRRLDALKEIHRGNGDPKIPCILRDVDDATVDSLSLGENFGREPMHPLDEAEAFAKLATADGKDANAIAAEFGVHEQYVRQRMKLATLAKPIKAAYREDKIDTGTAEAFAAVPEDRQTVIWKELKGNPQHAEHVRNIIANSWIDASFALFDVSTLPLSVVSGDLFSERVLVERQAFMEVQTRALEAKRQLLLEEGWKEAVSGHRGDVQDRLYSMAVPDREFDKTTEKKLAKISTRRTKLEEMAEKCPDDPAKQERLQNRFEELETQERKILGEAPVCFSEETKSLATVFLILDPDGQVHQEYRVPRQRPSSPGTSDGHGGGNASGQPKAPTSDELSDRQLAATFTHQALAVREALLKDDAARKRVLALILHDKVRSEALSIRHEPNGTTLHASAGEEFSSLACDRLKAKRDKLDPFTKDRPVEDYQGYEQLGKLASAKLDQLIDLLIVECITAHMQRRTELVHHLAEELKVNIRDFWRPDAAWLASYQKIQLAHLITELKGSMDAPSADRKKSELVEILAKLFADAADGKLEDKQLAKRMNEWLPSNMRELDE
jgi:ParB family chromosome partitioning protein